ncbi:hypothetical protein AAHH79_41780, partial [Burkholderia pseudomallei]
DEHAPGGSASASQAHSPAAPVFPEAPHAPDLSAREREAAALAEQTDALLAGLGITDADIARLLPAREAPAELNLDQL